MTGMDFGLDRDFGLGMKGEIAELEEVDSSPYALDEYNYSHEIDFGYYDEPVVKKSNDRNVDYIIRDERHVGGPSYEVVVDGHRDHNHHGNFAFVEEAEIVPEIHYDNVVHYDDSDSESEDEESEEEEQSGWGNMLSRWGANKSSNTSGSRWGGNKSGSRWGGNKSGSKWGGNKSKWGGNKRNGRRGGRW